MNRKFHWLLAVLAALCIATSALAEDVWRIPADQIKQADMKDLVYAVRDDFELKADFYGVDSPSPVPAVIMIHGGGFVRGSKDYSWFTNAANEFMAKGMAVLNIDYRVIPDGGSFPNNVTDVKCAVRWLRANAGELNVDPDRFGVMGESAGGYLASITAVTPDDPELDCEVFPDVSDSIQAAVIYYGLHDFGVHDQYFFMTMGELMWNKILKATDPLVVKSSPVTHVENAPPMLLFHGSIDNLVPVAHSRSMAKALEAAGKKYEYVEYEGLDHGFVMMMHDFPQARESLDRSIEFFVEELKPGQENGE